MATTQHEPSRGRRLWAIAALAGAAFLIGALVGAFHQPGEKQVVEHFASAWRRGDYAAMRALLSPDAHKRASATVFAGAYKAAAETATATSMVVGTPSESGGVYSVPVIVQTRIFGSVRGVVDIPLQGKGGSARVNWRANMTFPGLRPGERLDRTTQLPPRAELLARDGQALAKGPNRTSSLGDVATAAVGALGPIPADRAAALRAKGVPADTQVGVSGLERIFDAQLMGTPGGTLLAGTRVLARRAAVRAHDVRTTISPSVEQAAVTALAGRVGGIVAIRPKTGEILAFAGIPFSGLQPPGSTFKMVTLTSALENKVAGPNSTFPYETFATLEGVKLSNANGESCGGTLALAFAVSCNSVFAPLGAKLGAKRLVATAQEFGFNRPAPVPGAAMSTIPAPGQIGDDLAVGSSAIGQGRVQATTLQMTQIAATIALDGRRAGVTLDANKTVAPGPQVTRASVARSVRKMMIGVVRIGTGTSAAIPGVTVAGKTGTAELKTTVPCQPDPDNPESCPSDQQTNDPTDTDAWFAAFAPALSPKVAVGVLLVQDGAGGDTAAPVAKQVLEAALALKH